MNDCVLYDILITALPEIISGVTVALIVSLFAWIFSKTRLLEVMNARKLRKIGVESVKVKGIYSDAEISRIFNKSTKIRIYFTSGKTFFLKRAKGRIIKAMAKEIPPEIRVILGNPNGDYEKVVEEIERKEDRRKAEDLSIKEEITKIKEFLESENIAVNIDPSLYLMPYIIAENEKEYIAYLNLNIPPNVAANSLRIVAKYKKNSKDELEDDHLIYQLLKHFENAWKKAEELKKPVKYGKKEKKRIDYKMDHKKT